MLQGCGMHTGRLGLLGASHLDDLAGGEAVPQPVTGHHQARPLWRNLNLHDVWVSNDALAHIHVTYGTGDAQPPRPGPEGAVPRLTWLCRPIHVYTAS